MVVCLGTCCRAELWPSASDYCMLALNQWPLQRWCYWTYTYSFSALNHCEKAPFFISLGETEQRDRGNRPRCLLTVEASDKAHEKIWEIYNKAVWDKHRNNVLPSLPCIQSHLSYQEVQGVPMEGENHQFFKDNWQWSEFALFYSDSHRTFFAFVETILYSSCKGTATAAVSNTRYSTHYFHV